MITYLVSPHYQPEKTISRSVEVVYGIRHYLNGSAPSIICILASSTHSHLQYAIGAWGGVCKKNLQRLNILYNKIIRTTTYSSFRPMLAPLYTKKFNLFKVDDICNLEIGTIMHKIHSGNTHDNFKRLFTPMNQIHSHATRSATRGAFFWQAASRKYGKRSLKHFGP